MRGGAGPALRYLGDVSCPCEAEGDGPDGLWHEAHGDLVATVPDRLDRLAHVAVVVGHADVLRTGTGSEPERGRK
jgi:hypothetical protein